MTGETAASPPPTTAPEVVDAAVMRSVVETAINTLAAALDRLPNELASRLAGKHGTADIAVAAAARAIVDEARQRMVSDLTVLLSDPDPLS